MVRESPSILPVRVVLLLHLKAQLQLDLALERVGLSTLSPCHRIHRRVHRSPTRQAEPLGWHRLTQVDRCRALGGIPRGR